MYVTQVLGLRWLKPRILGLSGPNPRLLGPRRPKTAFSWVDPLFCPLLPQIHPFGALLGVFEGSLGFCAEEVRESMQEFCGLIHESALFMPSARSQTISLFLWLSPARLAGLGLVPPLISKPLLQSGVILTRA